MSGSGAKAGEASERGDVDGVMTGQDLGWRERGRGRVPRAVFISGR